MDSAELRFGVVLPLGAATQESRRRWWRHLENQIVAFSRFDGEMVLGRLQQPIGVRSRPPFIGDRDDGQGGDGVAVVLDEEGERSHSRASVQIGGAQ